MSAKNKKALWTGANIGTVKERLLRQMVTKMSVCR